MSDTYGEFITDEQLLRRELANARLERDSVAALNSSLIAELAAIKERIATYWQPTAEAWQREAETIRKQNFGFEGNNAMLQADGVELRKRIAGLEGASEDTPFEAVHAYIREGVLRAAEEIRQRDDVRAAHEIMASACQHAANRLNSELREMAEVRARAERAEAELADTKVHLTRVVSDFSTYVYRAEAELAEAKARIVELEATLDYVDVTIQDLQNANALPWKIRAERAEAERDQANESAVKVWGERDQYLESNVKLKDEILRLRAERDAMRGALSFYADERNWHTAPHCYSVAVRDCGTKARAALAPSREG